MQVNTDTSGKDSVTSSSQPPSVESDEDYYVKFLGINWNVKTDKFRYDLTELMSYVNSLQDTKRSVLKLAAKVFDPMSLLTPFTTNMKIFFQSLYTNGVDWEDKLDGKALTRWRSLVADLRGLNDVRVPRCYFKRTDEQSKSYQIYGFCDASDNAFAAAVYLRTEHRAGGVEVNLMASKIRVASIKKQTTPRLELMGANLLARLTDSILRVSSSLRATPKVILWADSFTTLCWIKNNKAWKQYVQHRVNEIRELTNMYQWRHCSRELNPADLPSPGFSVQELKKNETWWTGLRFLKFLEKQWPTDPQPTSKDKEQAFVEIIKYPPTIRHSLTGLSSSTHGSVNLEKLIDPQRYSTKTKMLRVTSIVLGFTRNLRKREPSTKMLELFAEELVNRSRDQMWIRCIQAFQADIRQLAIGRTNAMVKQLRLFIDTDNIVRCEGRISQSTSPKSAQQPILLTSKHRFTELVIREKHEVVHHDGIKETLNSVREKYWILRGREAVKRVVTKCVTCKKFQRKTFATPKDPPLPSSRVRDEPPFSNTGIDFAGPLYTSDNGSKIYICLFTCDSTRAVHLEFVDSLSVSAFLQAFRRFAARRGVPVRLISDNAKTFKSAANLKEVRSIGRSPEVQHFLANKGIVWAFMVEKAPWHGGFWERMFQSTNLCLRKSLGRTAMNFKSLRTLLIEIEATINNRPPTYTYDDEEGVSYPLTPSHLIYGIRIASEPNDRQFEIVSTHNSLTTRAQYHKRLLEQFTNSWKREYLMGLRETSVFLHRPSKEIIQVRDIVLLRNESKPRAFWKLVKVTELVRGRDGAVRSTKIQCLTNSRDKRPPSCDDPSNIWSPWSFVRDQNCQTLSPYLTEFISR